MSYHHLGAAADTLLTAAAALAPHSATPTDFKAASDLALTLGRSFSPGEMAIIADHMAGHAVRLCNERGHVPEITEVDRTGSPESLMPDWTGQSMEKRLRLCAYFLSCMGHLAAPSFHRILREIDARVANERARDLNDTEEHHGIR